MPLTVLSPHFAPGMTRPMGQKCLNHPRKKPGRCWFWGSLRMVSGKSLLDVNNSMPLTVLPPHFAGVMTRPMEPKMSKSPTSFKKENNALTHWIQICQFLPWKRLATHWGGICILWRHCTCSNIHGKRAAPFVIFFSMLMANLGWIALRRSPGHKSPSLCWWSNAHGDVSDLGCHRLS